MSIKYSMLLWLSLALSLAPARGETLFDLSSIDQITPDKLAPLLPEQPRGLGRPISDRAWWTNVAAECDTARFERKIDKINKLLNEYKPDFSDNAWLSRENNQYSKSMKMTLELIDRMMVIECLENKGRYLPDITRLVNRFCELKTWIGHYHDKDAYAFNGKGRFCELGSSRAGKLLATVGYLLGEKLPKTTREAIQAKTKEWLFEPYLTSIRDGKPIYGMGWINANNNWNAACHSQLCYAAAMLIDDKKERAEILSHAIKAVQKYVNSFTPDGYCSEGASYWKYGFGRYIELAELLYNQTNGKVNLLTGTDKIREIASYGLNISMSHQRLPAFADCPTNTRIDTYIATVLNARLRVPGYWEYSYANSNCALPFWSITQLTQTAELAASATPREPEPETAENIGHYFKDAGVIISRPIPSDSSRFALALKAGHNREFHNHNDIGTFVVDCDGVSVLTDPGYPVYTWTSFTPKRYESDAVNSFGHPVPVVNGHPQGNGDVYFKERYWGTVTRSEMTPEKTDVTIDLLKAYPDSCNAEKITRRFIHNKKERKITIIDEAKFSQPSNFATALLTYGKFKALSSNQFLVTEKGVSLNVHISGFPEKLKFSESKLKSKFMNRGQPTRLAIAFEDKSDCFKMTTTIQPARQ